MPYQFKPTSPWCTFDPSLMEVAVAKFCDAQGITTQAQLDVIIADLANRPAIQLGLLKALAGCTRLTALPFGP